jgi:phospholipid transport system substrate-binding protein
MSSQSKSLRLMSRIISKTFVSLIFLSFFQFFLPINYSFAEKSNINNYNQSTGTINEEFVRNFVQTTIDKTLDIVNSKQNELQKSQELQKIFEDCVDIDGMAKMAIGKTWINLSSTEQQQYLQSYKSFLIKTFIPKFKDYNSQKITITKINQIDTKKFVVAMQIVNNSSSASYSNNANKINVIYRILAIDGPKNLKILKIRDIAIEEMSLMRTQREDFANTINTKGIDGLISALKSKT